MKRSSCHERIINLKWQLDTLIRLDTGGNHGKMSGVLSNCVRARGDNSRGRGYRARRGTDRDRGTIDKPGTYTLVHNLPGPLSGPGDCLEIAADFVTIDLAGFTISGPGGGAGIAALTSGQGLAVRNGSISGFTIGIDLKLADGSIVEGLRVVGTSVSNVDGTIASGIMKGNTVISYQTGIIATGTVTGNYALSNSSIGFLIGAGSTVIGNTATGGRGGFLVSCPSNVTEQTKELFQEISIQVSTNFPQLDLQFKVTDIFANLPV
jgi:hypothetical protein